MRFNKIDKIILIGGGFVLSKLAQDIAEHSDFKIVIFSAKRHLRELVYDIPLRAVLKKNSIFYYESRNINNDKNLAKEITKNTLGIAMGAPWVFDKKTVNLFAKNHFLDFMNIDLPRYRGGAHHTWRILHQNRKGRLNLQVIHGGIAAYQKGEIIKREEFTFPTKPIKPSDYYNFAAKKEINFLKDFLQEIKKRINFNLTPLNEKESSYYPFLFTKFNGLINWSWLGKDICLFINAFDEPYPGASTYLGGKKVFLKDCQLLKPQEKYHPFTSGITVRKNEQGIFIATIGNLLKVKVILDGQGNDIIDSIELGDRLYTPSQKLDDAMTFKAIYDAQGLKNL